MEIKGSLNRIKNRFFDSPKNFNKVKEANLSEIKAAYQNRKTILESVPRIIQLEHSTFCNLECIGCPHFYQKNSFATHLDAKVVDRLIPIFPKVEQIQLNGGGEPFLAKGLEDALEVYSSFNIRITTTTNLLHLTHRILNVIRKSFSSINISFDGASKETFEGIRKKANFDKFLENVKNVRECRDDLNMVMGVTLMRQNICELPDILLLGKKLGFNKIVVGRMMPRPKSMPHTVKDDILFYPQVANHYFALARKVVSEQHINAVIPADLPITDNDLSFEDELDLITKQPLFPSKSEKEKYFETWWNSIDHEKVKQNLPVRLPVIEPKDKKIRCKGNCNWLFENIFINSKGDIATCCQMPNLSMGNVLEVDSFEEIWNGSGFVNLRQAFWDEFIPRHCYGCQFLLQNRLDVEILDNIDQKSFRSLSLV